MGIKVIMDENWDGMVKADKLAGRQVREWVRGGRQRSSQIEGGLVRRRTLVTRGVATFFSPLLLFFVPGTGAIVPSLRDM
jgi:hypothetical protein